MSGKAGTAAKSLLLGEGGICVANDGWGFLSKGLPQGANGVRPVGKRRRSEAKAAFRTQRKR